MSDRPSTSNLQTSESATADGGIAPPLLQQAYDALQELTSRSFAIEQTARGSLCLKSMMLEAVSLSNQLTGAKEASLFLLDGSGAVKESILARGATVAGQRQSLIGQVLDRGLAGWVVQNHKIGLIRDTETDDRWTRLASEPYVVRSALGVPLLKGKTLMGLLTLMHSEPEFFDETSVWIVEQIAPHLALVLDRAALTASLNKTPPPEIAGSEPEPAPPQRDSLLKLGQYIITADCKFLYVNHRFADIFEYSFEELAGLGSFLKLPVREERDRVRDAIAHCLRQGPPSLELTFKAKQKYGGAIEVEMAGNRTKFYGKFAIIGTLRAAEAPLS